MLKNKQYYWLLCHLLIRIGDTRATGIVYYILIGETI